MGAIFRDVLKKLEACHHGGGLDDVRLDFSTSLNPLGPPPSILESLRSLNNFDLSSYPDTDSSTVCEEIAEHLNLSNDEILLGNGASELLFMIPLISIEAGDIAIIPSPTYGEYSHSVLMMGGEVCRHELKRENNFRMDLDSFKHDIETIKPKLVFLCNPNNPTGEYLGREEVLDILETCRTTDTLLVIDEAYADLSAKKWCSDDLIENGNLIIVRSLTKSFSCAGIRIGYLIAAREIVLALKAVKIPWNVNILAQKVAITLTKEIDYLRRGVELVEREKAYLADELKRLSLNPIASDANYILVDLQGRSAASLNEKLLAKGIYLRDCTSFGLPAFVRIGIRNHEDNLRLVEALDESLKEW
ncbi:MAG: pyridoxal phosphate-dependent aminotransferase [Candidatus Syntropharchaeales archaeon]